MKRIYDILGFVGLAFMLAAACFSDSGVISVKGAAICAAVSVLLMLASVKGSKTVLHEEPHESNAEKLCINRTNNECIVQKTA